MKQKSLQIRRKLDEISDFLRQCRRELLSGRKGQKASNSDLRGYSFASAPVTDAKGKKQFWQTVSKKFRKKKVPVSTSYTKSGKLTGSKKMWLLPGTTLVVAVSLFITLGGPGWIGSLAAGFSFFKVRSVQYAGCDVVPEEQIRQLSGITLYQTSLLGLDQPEIVSNIEKHPWVRQARIERNWPTDLTVSITEYRPVALMNVIEGGQPQLYYVDRYGTPFVALAARSDADYPVITGFDRVSDDQERKAIFSEIYSFLRAVGRNNPNLPAQSVSEIHINEQGELVVYLVDYTFPIFLGRGEIKQKYQRLLKVLDSLYRGRGKGILLSGVEYIRMDYYNGKVLVAQSESS